MDRHHRDAIGPSGAYAPIAPGQRAHDHGRGRQRRTDQQRHLPARQPVMQRAHGHEGKAPLRLVAARFQAPGDFIKASDNHMLVQLLDD